MKHFAIFFILLVSIAATTGCGKKLTNNPNSPFNFFMLETGPNVTSITPADGEMEVPIATPIQVEFSTTMDGSSINPSTCFVVDDNYVPVDGSWATSDNISEFQPAGGTFSNLVKYTVLISTDVLDSSGNNLSKEQMCSFTTEYDGTVPSPTFTPAAGYYDGELRVSILCQDPQATIRYICVGMGPSLTNGPSPSIGEIYNGPVRINETTTIVAIAYRNEDTYSECSSITYTYKAATPVAYPPSGSFNASQTINVSTATPGATITYSASLVATEAGNDDFDVIGEGYQEIFVTIPATAATATYLVTATAYKTGFEDSDSLTAYYTMGTNLVESVAAPIFSPPAGIYTTGQRVTISSYPADAIIQYTTDGGEHWIDGNTVNVADTMTIQARALSSAGISSTLVTAPYIIAPTVLSITPKKGPSKNINKADIEAIISGTHFKEGASVALQCAGVSIPASNVTINNSTITCSFNLYQHAPGLWDVVVTNYDGGTATLTGGFWLL